MPDSHNNAIDLHIDRQRGIFSLLNCVRAEECEMWVSGRRANGQPFTFPIRLDTQASVDNPLSTGGEEWVFSGSDAPSGLSWRADFRLSANRCMLCWRVELVNQSGAPCRLERIGLLRPARGQAGNLPEFQRLPPEDISIFCNGWQSWSYSAAYRGDQRMRRSRLGLLQEPMVLNPDTPLPRQTGAFGSDFFSALADTRRRSGLLLGFLSQKEQFGSLSIDLRDAAAVSMWANADGALLRVGERMTTDWAVALPFDLNQADPLDAYLRAVAEEHGILAHPPALAGWCSWYEYYQNISADIIRANLAEMNALREQLPLDLLQIDDGFQEQVGDWLRFNSRFPQGVAGLAREIQASERTPGLWLAPFILHPASRTARRHSDWLLRDARGRLARAGFGWNALAVALDLTVPDALAYASEVVHKAVHDWGYPYLKLDFLYAAALKGCYRNPTRTRAQVLRAGMGALREAAGEATFLLGCGAPLGSVLGLVQGMRIGADVSAHWKPVFHGIGLPFKNEPHMPGARNALQNTLTRAALHQRWWVNDPDCLLVRPDARLSLLEMHSLATVIALTGGSLLLSDDFSKLTPERQRLVACLLPPINRRARVLDWMDAETPSRLRLDLESACGRWTLAAAFNWADQDRQVEILASAFDLPADQDYWVRSFWDDRLWLARPGQPLFSGHVPAHGTVLLALRLWDAFEPQYLGGDLHISQGLEVKGWAYQLDSTSLVLDVGRYVEGAVDLFLPYTLRRAELDGAPVSFAPIAEGCWRVSVELKKHARLLLTG